MPQTIKELRQLRGIGPILAKRLFDAGLESCQKVAQAGEEGLKKIRGITPRMISSILEQARELSQGELQTPQGKADAVREKVATVRNLVQELTKEARTRFGDKLSVKSERKLSLDLVRLEDVLQRCEKRPPKRGKRAEKALAKAQKRVEGLDGASPKRVHKGLKKARLAVLTVLR